MEKKQVTLSKFFAQLGKLDTDKNFNTDAVNKKRRFAKRKDTDQDKSDDKSNKKFKRNSAHETVVVEVSDVDVDNDSLQKDNSVRLSESTLQKLQQFSSEVETETIKRDIRPSRNAPDIDIPFEVVPDSSDEADVEIVASTSGTGASTSRLNQFSAVKSKKSVSFNKKYTPLEQQFLEIKEQNEDTILFVECGYKYRFFREDAEIAAQVLKIYCHVDHNFMTASIPTHRLFVHLRRLVAAGYKVGVVKQMETAALKAAGDNKNAPFTRKLTALYTKSTLIGEDVDPLSDIDDSQTERQTNSMKPNNYLMCIYDGVGEDSANRNIAIVAIDPATGDVIYDNFIDDEMRGGLDTRIAHINPVEMLLPQTISYTTNKLIQQVIAVSSTEDDRVRIEKLDDKNFTPEKSQQIISDFVRNDNETILQEILNLPKPVICCISGLIVYLQDFNLHNILKITGNFNKFSVRSKYMQLSGTTLRNLEIFENSTDRSEKGCLFWILNHTLTKYGNRLFTNWIANPLLDIGGIIERQNAIENILNKSLQKLNKLKMMMNKSPDLEKALCSIFHKKSSVIEFYTVVKSLEKINLEIKQITADQYLFKDTVLLNCIFNELPELLYDITDYSQAINEKAARENDKIHLFKNESDFPDILIMKQNIADVLKEIKGHRKDIRLLLHQPSLDYVTVSQTEFLIEVKNTLLKQVPNDWVTISSTKTVSRFHSPFIVLKTKKLSQLREQLAASANAAWFNFLGQFGENFVRYRKAIQHLATLDCLLSLSTVSQQNNYCRPVFVENELCIIIKQGRHPIISSLLREQEQFVPNDTELASERAMIITGPNMGGKSSYIRQVALLCIMAQLGSYIPADTAQLSVVDAIFTRMGAADDIFKGRSTFMVELQEASAIMKEATSKSLVILDELGRGTSTYDGLAIAQATAHYFIQKVQCFTLFVTHYPSLSELEISFPSVVGNYHMSFILHDQDESSGIDEESITFLYELVRGQAGKSYGLNVARLADIHTSIIRNAQIKSQQMENIIQDKRTESETFCGIVHCDNQQKLMQIIKQILPNKSLI